ncbi:sulfate transporter family-domain-containing protein [Circinella umbellata]|nr:sulfate transporter family-domain-containing protein [Circinella umbellata]
MNSSSVVVLDYEPVTFKNKTDKFKQNWGRYLSSYIFGFFPILQWITRYNTSWMLQDMIAGGTVGMVLVPQGIAYAKIANLDPQYGLYSSFAGACFYCLFGTSKDISIGPITVVSLLVGRAVTNVTTAHPEITGPEVAVFLSVLVGIITMLMGMIRLGILVDFIPAPAIAGFMTGSAITISLGQWGKLTGIKLDTHQAPYLIVGEFFSSLGGIRVDIAFGLTCLIALYAIKHFSTKLATRWPKFKQSLFYFGIMRNGTIVIMGTFISFCINVHDPTASAFKIIKSVPSGFDAIGVPNMSLNIMSEIGDVLPSIIIILVLEHISVAKAFGRASDYTIDSNQEILAIGVTNLVGSFFGSYPGTGAFSRTAIMARSGAKTPLSSAFSAIIVVLALYVLTPAFYYIPEAALAAVVIHAVSDLISSPKYVKELYNTSKLEFLVFASAVLITIFDGIEDGIYTAVALSLIIMLFNLARPKVEVMARSPLDPTSKSTLAIPASNDFYSSSQHYIYFDEQDPHFQTQIEPLPPGVVVLRINNALLYPNSNYVTESIIATAKKRTRQGETEENKKELLWTQSLDASKNNHLPLLEAVVLDFSSVSRIDSTALQMLSSAREQLDRYSSHAVEWHFTGVVNSQVRSDLLLFGFGTMEDSEGMASSSTSNSTLYASSCVSGTTAATKPSPKEEDSEKIQEVTFKDSPEVINQNSIIDNDNNDKELQVQEQKPEQQHMSESYYADPMDVENIIHSYYMEDTKFSQIIVDPHNYLPRDRHPCFHWDVDSAVRSICERWSSRRPPPILLPPPSGSSSSNSSTTGSS